MTESTLLPYVLLLLLPWGAARVAFLSFIYVHSDDAVCRGGVWLGAGQQWWLYMQR